MKNTRKYYNLILLGLLCTMLAGCSPKDINMDSLARYFFKDTIQENQNPSDDNQVVVNGMDAIGHGAYDSKDTAAIKALDGDACTITLVNHNTSREYTLDYSEILQIHDKYDQNISMAQLHVGDIVDVCFQKSSKKLIALKASMDAWMYDNVNDYIIDRDRGEISFGSNLFSFDKKMVIAEERAGLELDDINDSDVLRVAGVGQQVYSIVITKGHGYLRLEGEDYFVDGWIEIGKQIQRITKGMLMTVPVGQQKVVISSGGHGGQKSVTIYSGEETTLNIEDLKGEDVKYGKIIFTTTPYDATILVDGKEIDKSEPCELEYGIHSMIAKAEGYDTISQYIKIAKESASLDIVMEHSDSVLTEEPDEELPDNGEVNIDTGVYYVHVAAPIGAEVYMDGVYIGVAPTSIEKKEGTHTITLRKEGYQNKSYSIQVNSEKKDLELSFSELEEKGGSTKKTQGEGNMGTDTGQKAENLFDAAEKILNGTGITDSGNSQGSTNNIKIPSTSNTMPNNN